MNVRISKNLHGKTVAVAVSGGADSMALLHYTVNFCRSANLKPIALNVEHGIRGENSLRDTEFVKNYCTAHNIPLLTYNVDALKKSREEKISLEQAARVLRYESFYDAIKTGKCDAVFTAHHSADNLESVLFNLFRGTSVKGLTGIKDYDNKIYRPFIGVSKAEISEYIKKHKIPFVNDETNFCDDYTRNFLRLNVIPKIKEIFPEAEKSVLRLSETLQGEDEYLDIEAKKILSCSESVFSIPVETPHVLMARAVVIALKQSGITRDYEKVHVDDICALCEKENGKTVVLPRGIKATREYDKITIYNAYKRICDNKTSVPFSTGENSLNGQTVNIEFCENVSTEELKKGFYADFDKIPINSVIRFRKTGDRFTKLGGGTKSLSDFLTDKKIPLKDRNNLLLIANGNDVLAIFGIAVSEKVKIDKNTKKIIKLL